MAFTFDNYLDSSEQIRVLELAKMSGQHCDIVMLLESPNGIVQGESVRQFEDGSWRLDVVGYTFGLALVLEQTQSVNAFALPKKLSVVRRCDVATASLFTHLVSMPGWPQSRELKRLVLSVFRAGGDNSRDAQPTLEMEFFEPVIQGIDVLTSEQFEFPHEIIDFQYTRIEVRSAPQTKTGQRGAVRTFRASF
jgi:type VI protein secretion system component Hcp